MSVPLIGISTSELRNPKEHVNRAQSEPPMRELALGLTYPEAVTRAGAVPVVIPPFATDEQTIALLDRVDGICLAGGPDLHPSYYGEVPHPNLGPTERELDRSELTLVERALDRGLPLLCICRGAQLLNVARGGTLVQDLPGHRQTEPGRFPVHSVTLEPDSRLARILATTELRVNSFHHQAVERLGRGLRIVGRAEDGVVEAIEVPEHPFALGVQWHAEGMVDAGEQHALFEAFTRAAAPRRRRRMRAA